MAGHSENFLPLNVFAVWDAVVRQYLIHSTGV